MLGPENLLRDWIRAAEDSLPGASASSRAQVAEEAASRARRLAEIAAEFQEEPPAGAEDVAADLREGLALLASALERLQSQALGAPGARAAALADEAEDLLLSVEHRMATMQGADWEG